MKNHHEHDIASEEIDLTSVQSLLNLLSNVPETFLFSLLIKGNEDENNNNHYNTNYVSQIRGISRNLFKILEKFATLYLKLEEKIQDVDTTFLTDESTTVAIGPLSGVSDLTLSFQESSYFNSNIQMDAETIWGQVDLQNIELIKLTSKSIRRFTKLLPTILDQESGLNSSILRLVDLTEIQSDEEDGEESFCEEEKKNDRVTLHMHHRMERVMGDVETERCDNSTKERQGKVAGVISDESHDNTEDIHDPAAEELNDGFFDLDEVEAFADEEEDIILNSKDVTTDSIDIEGDTDNDSVLNQSRNLGIKGKRRRTTTNDGRDGHRKRYREDEDIEALMALYKDERELGGEINGKCNGDEYITTTAQDYFGPRKKNTRTSYETKTYLDKERNKDKIIAGNERYENVVDDLNGPINENSIDYSDKSGSFNQMDHFSNDSPSKRGDEMLQRPSHQFNQSIKMSKQSSTKLVEQIEKLEQDMLAEKPWSILGESKGADRPVDSLLDKTPEFEFATKIAPVITEAHSLSIEDMIRSRIIAEDWDDVIPRELPDVGWCKRRGEAPDVSQEKSKLSLGTLYEREYLKKTSGYDVDTTERQSEEEKNKGEIRKLFANLCSRLDALSNYHFAPRPIADEAEVKTVSTPAIAMEEVLPLHVSNARVSAPEEIFATKQGKGGILRGDSELDQVSINYC